MERRDNGDPELAETTDGAPVQKGHGSDDGNPELDETIDSVPVQKGPEFNDAQTLINPPGSGSDQLLPEPPPGPVAEIKLGQAAAKRAMQAQFEHLPGASELLADVPVQNPTDHDLSTVVSEAAARLGTLPAIFEIIGDNRAKLERLLLRAVRQSTKWTEGSGVNTAILVHSDGSENLEEPSPEPPDLSSPGEPTEAPPLGSPHCGLLYPIGSGGFGSISKIDVSPNFPLDGISTGGETPECVSKILRRYPDPEQERTNLVRFKHEWKTLQLIQDSVPEVYAHGVTAEGRPFYIMRYIEGLDFEKIIAAVNLTVGQEGEPNKPARPSQWMYLALASIGKTMNEIHNPVGSTEVVSDVDRLSELGKSGELNSGIFGIVHRDLKPGNVRLDKDGRVYILDFGLGLPIEGNQTRLTVTGGTIGTPSYMAPEIIQAAKHNTTTKVDVYSLGCMAYEFLTGEIPFAEESKGGIMHTLTAHQTKSPKFNLIPNVRARRLIVRMMQKNPEFRPDMNEIAQEFLDIFLVEATEEERGQYADFLSLPPVERKLPIPDGIDISNSDGTKEASTSHATSLAESLGSGESKDATSDSDVGGTSALEYGVGEDGKFVELTRLVRLGRFLRRIVKDHPIRVIGGAILITAAAAYSINGLIRHEKVPIFPTVMRAAKPDESPKPLAIRYEEDGTMKTVFLFEKAIDGKDIYQFSAHRDPDAEENGLPPDCHFGICFLSEKDLADFLGIEEKDLPDSVRKKSIYAVTNPDGSKRKEHVSGSLVYIYDIDGQLFAVVTGIGFLNSTADGSNCYTHLPKSLLRDSGRTKVHRFSTLSDAMNEGYSNAGPIASFPERMKELILLLKLCPHLPQIQRHGLR